MAIFKSHEKIIFERLFDRGGYVLNFSDRTFGEFFREFSINIDDAKYAFNGPSKMKRLRAFWEIESDKTVGTVLEGLLQYANAIGVIDREDEKKAEVIINRLLEKPTVTVKNEPSEKDFLNQSFASFDIALLALDPQLEPMIAQRIDEIQKALASNASLAVIFLCGSTLEGLLQDAAIKNIQKFNTASAAPKKDGKVLKLNEWTLEGLINVAHETGIIGLDVKKYGHALRDFRNYIHPREQALQNFNPDKHTAEISWKVLQAAIAGLSGQRGNR